MARLESSKPFATLSESAEITRWINEVMTMTGIRERLTAYRAVAAVLHALRDQLPEAESSGLAAQLPSCLRDIFNEKVQTVVGDDAVVNFAGAVAAACPALSELQAERAIWAVFTMLSHHVSPDVIRRVRGRLPAPVRAIWNTAA